MTEAAIKTRASTLVLDRLVAGGFCFAVLHGLEHYPRRIGRDVDLWVHPDEAGGLETVITGTLRGDGWRVGLHRMAIGIHQIFASLETAAGKVVWLEFDVIHRHPFRWKGQPLVPVGLDPTDLGKEKGYPCYVYGWVAKNLLMQLLSGKREKFLKNRTEFREKEGFVEKAEAKARKMGLLVPIRDVMQARDEEDFDRLRSRITCQVFVAMARPQRFFLVARSFPNWVRQTWYFYFPKEGCAPKIHLHQGGSSTLREFAEKLKEAILATTPFPKVRVVRGSSLAPKGRNPFSRLLGFRKGGWERQVQRSSTLTVQIELWPDVSVVTAGEKITPGDFSFAVGRNCEKEGIRLALARLEQGFFCNLSEAK